MTRKPLTALAMAQNMAENMPGGSRKTLMFNAIAHAMTPYNRVRYLKELFGDPTPPRPVMLSVTDRDRLLHLILEEFLELVEASGFEVRATVEDGVTSLDLYHVEGSIQDTVEMVDALADIIVTTDGMAVEMGHRLDPVVREVVAGSITKLCPQTGEAIRNGISEDYKELWDPNKPKGKWCKGPNYMAPQLHYVIQLPTPKEI